MSFKIDDLFKTLVPELLIYIFNLIDMWQVLPKYIFRVDPRDQHIFIMSPVKYPKFSPAGQSEIMPPEVIVFKFQGCWGFKTVYHHPAGIKTFKNFTYQTILTRGIHTL